MWHFKRISLLSNPNLVNATRDLLRDMARTMIVAVSAIYLLWHLAGTVLWPSELGVQIWAISACFVPFVGLVLYWLPKRPLATQAFWQAGLAALIMLAILIFQRPEVAMATVLLPLMAVVMIGWPAGVIMQLFVTALALWLTQGLLTPALGPAFAAAIIVGGAISGLLGWIATHTLVTVAEWSLFGFSQAQQHMEEAQQHRAKMTVMLKDLDHAYYRLERSNTALVAARKAAEEAERFKAEFVANVSHELRTPLNLIVGFSEVIMTSPESYGVDLPRAYRSDLNAIYRSAQHLLSLVDDVLDLARIEAGKISLVREEVELTSLVAEVADTMRDYINAKGLTLQVQLEPNLPRLWLDRLRIRQVLLNLLVNASRFTERGSITIQAREQEEGVLLKVIDTGKGIPSQDLPKVFEEFRSTEQPVSAWHSGTGLGLPISKKFVELHQGQMGVESVYGEGASFWISLPMPTFRITEAAHASGRWNPLVPLGTAERIVVVIHDDAHVIALLQRHLENLHVMGAATPAEGTRLARETQAIAIITPDTSGLQQAEIECPVVRCPLPSSRQAAFAMRATDLLTKPVSREDLLKAIQGVEKEIRTILIVDDEPNVVRLFQRMLRSHPSVETCIEAYDGAAALEILREQQPDLVLLDLHMPEIDGQGVLDAMAADPLLASIPVIIISGQGYDYLNVPIAGAISVEQKQGLLLGEVMQTVDSVINALAPGWRQLSSMEPERAAKPAG